MPDTAKILHINVQDPNRKAKKSFPVMHKVGNVGIFVLLKFKN